jgi:demethylmenaquinone methyltransferase/2-methoxy-6-polyprenyl-1,4-benzoquinol methylase
MSPRKPSEFTPHPALTAHYDSLDEKQAYLRRAFDAAAPYYEGIAKWGFFGTGDWYRRQALRRCGVRSGMRLVDVASGTGPTARAAAAIVGDPSLVTCVEPSIGMLRESEKRLRCRHVQASAENIPLDDASFDFLAMGFALRHVQNLRVAFSEFFRVLEPGATVCILDLTKPDNALGYLLLRLYFRDLFPLLTRLFSGSEEATYLMKYYWETLDQMVEPAIVLEALSEAGFEHTGRHVVLGMFSEYTGVKP